MANCADSAALPVAPSPEAARAGAAGKEIRATKTTETGNHRAAIKDVNKRLGLSAELPRGCAKSDFNSGIFSHRTKIWQRYPTQHQTRPIHARKIQVGRRVKYNHFRLPR
jgi:hypothetical protein